MLTCYVLHCDFKRILYVITIFMFFPEMLVHFCVFSKAILRYITRTYWTCLNIIYMYIYIYNKILFTI